MANTLDVLTLEEAKAAVNLSANRAGNEETLEQAVTAVSQLLDDLCGPVVIRTITDEIIQANGQPWIATKYQPVASVTTLTEYTSGTPTVLTAEDFDTVGTYLLQDNLIYRRSGWYGFNYSGTVKITYTAGRYATTAAVDAKFKRAAAEILQGNWSKYAAAWARGGDAIADPLFFDEVSHVVARWLSRERLAPGIA